MLSAITTVSNARAMSTHVRGRAMSGSSSQVTDGAMVLWCAHPGISRGPMRAMGLGKIRLVVCDLSASPYIDLAGSRMLHQLHTELGSLGINLRIVGARGRVRDLLRAEGIDEKVGGLDRLKTLDELLESARKEAT